MKPVSLSQRIPLHCFCPASLAVSERGVWIADVEKGTLFLTDIPSGEIIETIPSIVRRPQTITWDGTYLWEYDEETGELYKNGLNISPNYRFGRVEGLHTPYYGFCYHGKTLWVMTPDQPEFTVNNNQISVIDFPRCIQSETFEAPTHSCRGLSHDGRYLWTLDVELKEIFALDPLNGTVLASYPLTHCVAPSSLCVQQNRIWTIDLRQNELLSYSLDRTIPWSASGGRSSVVDLVYTLRNNGPGVLREVEIYNSIPKDYLNQRVTVLPHSSPEPTEILESQWDEGTGEVFVHRFNDIAPADERQCTISFSINTVNITYHLFPHSCGTLDEIPQQIKENYLLSAMVKSPDPVIRDVVNRAQLLFQTGEQEIKEKVRHIVGDEQNTYWIARKLYNYVVETIEYVLPYTSLSSRKILKQGKGSCGNHATIFIAFCQVAGLPARSIIGFSLWKDDSRLGYLDHEIPEVYLPQYGWVPVDTSRFMSLPIQGTNPLTKFRSFGTLSDRFFVNGFGRDLRSPFAIKRHREERLVRVDNEQCHSDLRFFMRWQSKGLAELPDWAK